jgi:hypothetical protein
MKFDPLRHVQLVHFIHSAYKFRIGQMEVRKIALKNTRSRHSNFEKIIVFFGERLASCGACLATNERD